METVTFKGKVYRFEEQAEIADTTTKSYADEMVVTAIGEDGKEYCIFWEMPENWRELSAMQGDLDVCDWDNPSRIELV